MEDEFLKGLRKRIFFSFYITDNLARKKGEYVLEYFEKRFSLFLVKFSNHFFMFQHQILLGPFI